MGIGYPVLKGGRSGRKKREAFWASLRVGWVRVHYGRDSVMGTDELRKISPRPRKVFRKHSKILIGIEGGFEGRVKGKAKGKAGNLKESGAINFMPAKK